MKLIVGLGNPGEKYKNNRHNAGYMFVDYLLQNVADNPQSAWKYDKYLIAEVANIADTITVAKPQTFMNKSGEAVRKFIDKWQLKTEDLIVAHDDLDIPLGHFRIVRGYGPKLHNGLESIENHLHTKDFLRVRIGVDNRTPENRIPGIDYVLQNFLKEERQALSLVFPKTKSLLQSEYHLL